MKNPRIKRLFNRARVLFYLSQFLTVPEVAQKISSSARAVYRLKMRLEKDGLINKDRSLTKAGAQIIKNVPVGLRNVPSLHLFRLHNCVAKMAIIEKPVNWDKYLERVDKLGFRDYNSWPLASGVTIASFFLREGVRVRLTPNFVFLSVGAIWEGDAEAAKQEFERRVAMALPEVESKLGLRVLRAGEARFAVSRQEYAVMGRFAERLAQEGWKINVYSEDGSEKRIILDKSLGVAEVEAVNRRFALQDAQQIEDLLFDVCVEQHSFRKLAERIQSLEAKLEAVGAAQGARAVERREIA